MNDEKTKVVFESCGDNSATYSDFCSKLPAKNCRYGVILYKMELSNGVTEKVVFVSWAPDGAPVKEKKCCLLEQMLMLKNHLTE